MPYQIDIQKALSFPHCTEVYKHGDARCAVGAVISALQLGQDVPFFTLGEYIGKKQVSHLSSIVLSWLEEYHICGLVKHYMIPNDSADNNLERDLLRRKFITMLLENGAVVPCAKDAELARELMETKVCQTV